MRLTHILRLLALAEFPEVGDLPHDACLNLHISEC